MYNMQCIIVLDNDCTGICQIWLEIWPELDWLDLQNRLNSGAKIWYSCRYSTEA